MSSLYKYLRYDWPLHFVLLLTNWLPHNVVFLKFRGWLAKPFFRKCGKSLRIGRDVTFFNPSNMTIGDRVYIAKGSWLLGVGEIFIEDEVLLAPYVLIVTANHSFERGAYRNGPAVDVLPVKIGAGSWLSGHCTILPGSDLGKGVLIAANSVFKGKAEDGAIFGGIPAKLLKSIDINS